MAIGFTVAAGAAAGRIAFDSLLHRDGPEHLRGRAFARFETRFQLAWVRGALVPVALLDVIDRRSGFFLLALVLFFSGLSYVGGLRARHEWGGVRADAAGDHRKAAGAGAGDRRDCLTVDVELRAVTEDELDAFVLADGYGFGFRWGVDESAAWPRHEMERTVAAIVDGDIVATGRNYTLELTMPGGAIVPAGGVSWISTRPTHRRRGLLTQVMRYLVEESRARGEIASLLTASEGGIYPRFGYGVATRVADVRVPACRAPTSARRCPTARGCGWWSPTSRDRSRPRCSTASVATAPGAVSRPTAWWADEWASEEWIDAKRRFDVIVEIDGEPAGHAIYAIDGAWREGFSEKVVAVRDLLAVSPEAELALWHFLGEHRPDRRGARVEPPARRRAAVVLTDARHARVTNVRDFLWLRPIDTAALLGARTYGVDGALTLAGPRPVPRARRHRGHVHDRRRARRREVRAHRRRARPRARRRGARCRRPRRRAAERARPRRAARRPRTRPRSRRADAMFAADREPYAATWF